MHTRPAINTRTHDQQLILALTTRNISPHIILHHSSLILRSITFILMMPASWMVSERRLPELRRAISAFVDCRIPSATRFPILVSLVRTCMNLPSKFTSISPITSSSPPFTCEHHTPSWEVSWSHTVCTKVNFAMLYIFELQNGKQRKKLSYKYTHSHPQPLEVLTYWPPAPKCIQLKHCWPKTTCTENLINFFLPAHAQSFAGSAHAQ